MLAHVLSVPTAKYPFTMGAVWSVKKPVHGLTQTWRTFVVEMYDGETGDSAPPFGDRHIRVGKFDVLDEIEVPECFGSGCIDRGVIVRSHLEVDGQRTSGGRRCEVASGGEEIVPECSCAVGRRRTGAVSDGGTKATSAKGKERVHAEAIMQCGSIGRVLVRFGRWRHGR